MLTEDLRKKYPFRKVSVAFIDCDLYFSTRDVLNWLRSYLTEGSLVLMDDWRTCGENPELGQPKALYEFLRENPQFEAEDRGSFPVNGKTFEIHVKRE